MIRGCEDEDEDDDDGDDDDGGDADDDDGGDDDDDDDDDDDNDDVFWSFLMFSDRFWSFLMISDDVWWCLMIYVMSFGPTLLKVVWWSVPDGTRAAPEGNKQKSHCGAGKMPIFTRRQLKYRVLGQSWPIYGRFFSQVFVLALLILHH